MKIPKFDFPVGCKINGNKEIFVTIAAEGNQLPHEQCGHKESCSVLEECTAEGRRSEKSFRDYKKPKKETNKQTSLC